MHTYVNKTHITLINKTQSITIQIKDIKNKKNSNKTHNIIRKIIMIIIITIVINC